MSREVPSPRLPPLFGQPLGDDFDHAAGCLRDLQTTRMYVSRSAVKRDRHGRAIAERLGVGVDRYTE